MPQPEIVQNITTIANSPIVEQYRRRLTNCYARNIRSHTSLIPIEDCHEIIRDLEAEDTPAGYDSAKSIVAFLFNLYPREQCVKDATVYTRGLILACQQVPAKIGYHAAYEVARLKNTYPTLAEWSAVLNKLQSERRQMMEVARDHLREHTQRQGASERRAKRPSRMSPSEKEQFLNEIAKIKLQLKWNDRQTPND